MTPEGLTTLADVEAPSNPFPGLRPFEFGESHLYFGRDGQSDQLIRKLAATRFVAVVGTSGSGKSSLVRAGLLPDLFGGFMPSAGSHWRVCLMRPSNDPLGNLARGLSATGVFGSEIEENRGIQAAIAEATLRRGSLGLVEVVRQNRMPAGENLLVVVDQFEELFRFARVSGSEQYRYEAAAFVKLLLEAARQREHNIYVVLTMRSDFLGDCSIFWDLPEAVNEGQYLIPRMTRDQRAEAITGPIAVCGGAVTHRLVNRLLNDTGDSPDMLPILQHALMRTWENWKEDHAEGEPVDLRHYEAVGTMSDALSRHADEAYAELPDERGRQIAERVFKALTEKGEDNREVRRPTVLAELCAQAEATPPEVVAVVEVFRREGRSFLMPPAGVALGEESLIDISHESLIRNWERLKAWVDEESQSAQIYRRLAETAVLHERGHAGLWRDPDLQVALDWRERTRPTPTWAARYHPSFETAMAFLDASVAARDAAVLEEERRRRREIRRTRLAAAFFFLLFMLALAAFAFAYTQTIQAQEALGQAEQARARAEAANARAEQALADAERERDRANEQFAAARRSEMMALAAEEDARAKQAEAETARAESEASKAEAEKQAGIARTNELAAVAAKEAEEEATLRAIAEAEQSRRLLYASEMSLAQQAYEAGNIERGRDLLAKYRGDGGVAPPFEWRYLWNLFNAEKARPGGVPSISSSALSGDGNFLVLNTGDTVEVRRPTEETSLFTIQTTGDLSSYSVAISRDGKLVAYSPDMSYRVKVVEVASGTSYVLAVPAERVTDLAFSPDGKTLAAGTEVEGQTPESKVALWNLETRQKLYEFTGSTTVRTLAYSPDGRRLAVGYLGGPLSVYDPASGSELCGLKVQERAPNESAHAIAFLPAGDSLVAATTEGGLMLFNLSNCRTGGRLVGVNLNPTAGSPAGSSVAFSPDGKLMAVSFQDNTIKLWRVSGRPSEPIATFKGHLDYINLAAFLPDSRTLVTTSFDDQVMLWDTEALVRDQRVLAMKSPIRAVTFSPDGARLAVGANDKEVTLWDAASAEQLPVPEPAHGGPVAAVAFSPDGRLLVTGAEKPALTLRDAKTFKVLGSFEQQKDSVSSAAFSPDGTRLVTDDGSSIRLWDVASRRLLKETASSLDTLLREGTVSRVAFSPDGSRIASGTSKGLVKLWDAGLTQVLGEYSVVGKGDLSVITALAFSPDGSVLVASIMDSSVRLLSGKDTSPLDFLRGHKGEVWAAAFSPDGKTIATGGGDGTVRLWSAVSRKELLVLRGHEDAVTALAFSPDGKVLASAGYDRKVRLWRAPGK